jgi:hypothetical protein
MISVRVLPKGREPISDHPLYVVNTFISAIGFATIFKAQVALLFLDSLVIGSCLEASWDCL